MPGETFAGLAFERIDRKKFNIPPNIRETATYIENVPGITDASDWTRRSYTRTIETEYYVCANKSSSFCS
jgi:hypothetical protein